MFSNISEYKFLNLIERDMHDRTYRILKVYDCEQQKEITFSVSRKVDIPKKLRKHEKIILGIHLTMYGRNAIPIIKQIKRKEDDEKCSQMTQN